jgi:uncharacterized protein HemX
LNDANNRRKQAVDNEQFNKQVLEQGSTFADYDVPALESDLATKQSLVESLRKRYEAAQQQAREAERVLYDAQRSIRKVEDLKKSIKPAIVPPPAKTRLSGASTSEPKSAYDWRVELQERWSAWSTDLWNDIRALVRVRTVTKPEALLLTPEQAFFARENLKLRLLNARVALLSRNDPAFRSDLAEADRALVRYFDPRDRRTQAGRELIRQMQESVLNIDMPTLSHSLAAVRQSRSRP